MQEKRPLKRPKLGPPDVYPQDAKQKEDELTATNVKQGFISMLFLQGNEEFGTARNCNVTASKVGAYFNAILARREELMTLPDSGRKKQQINVKDNFWHVSNRSRATLDIWFKDLAGNKPLTSLSKRAPSFNKKEDIFPYLCDNNVSMQKAAWFIKLNSAYTTAVSEAKIKKRQMPDPTTEWTGTMIKFMKDLIPKLQEHYHQSPLPEKLQNLSSSSNVPNNPPAPPSMTVPQPLTSPAANIHSPANASSTPSSNQQAGFTQEDYKTALKQWTYCIQLCKYMFEEGLLDRHEFLNWVLDLLDKMKSQPSDDGILKLFLPITMQYMTDFVQSERLSRRLAYMVCKKLSFMISSAQESKENLSAMGNLVDMKPEPHSIKVEAGDVMMNNASPMNQNDMNMNLPLTSKSNGLVDHNLNEYLQCPHHRDLIIQLSAILQVITIECPTALVWCGLGETKASAALMGSPLDHLTIPPSSLPILNKCQSDVSELQAQLREAEENIRKRSIHAEVNKWCTEKWQNKNGNASAIVLASLDALDSHCFDRMDTNSNNNLEALYAKIFPPFVAVKQETARSGEVKETKIDYDPNKDAPIVQILLSWAVSSQRFGEHRAMAVAWLLDKRQSEVTASDTESSNADDNDKESIGSAGCYGGVPVFQGILMNFLDKDAPVLEENGSVQNRSQFTNLVHLFSELIRHDVFSHDAYMCTLISRGDLLTGSSLSMKNSTGISAGTVSNKTSPHNQNQGLDDDMFTGIDFKPKMEEFDDSNVDDDLDKILQNIKEDQQNAMDAPDSPKDSEQHHHSATHMSSDPPISRHFLYAKHFPLCQDDSVSQHDTNQRYILLFGVGKERDEKKHAVKKMSKGL